MSKDYKEIIKKMVLPPHVKEIIEGGAEIIIPDTKEHLFDLALGGKDNMTYDVNFDVNGKTIREAYITKCKNGLSVNFDDTSMRRRDPNSMVIADDRKLSSGSRKETVLYLFLSILVTKI